MRHCYKCKVMPFTCSTCLCRGYVWGVNVLSINEIHAGGIAVPWAHRPLFNRPVCLFRFDPGPVWGTSPPEVSDRIFTKQHQLWARVSHRHNLRNFWSWFLILAERAAIRRFTFSDWFRHGFQTSEEGFRNERWSNNLVAVRLLQEIPVCIHI